jgi:hypothetical protein
LQDIGGQHLENEVGLSDVALSYITFTDNRIAELALRLQQVFLLPKWQVEQFGPKGRSSDAIDSFVSSRSPGTNIVSADVDVLRYAPAK